MTTGRLRAATLARMMGNTMRVEGTRRDGSKYYYEQRDLMAQTQLEIGPSPSYHRLPEPYKEICKYCQTSTSGEHCRNCGAPRTETL